MDIKCWDKLTDDQIQRLLICEHGSINESYVEAYELTGEKRFLDWARRLNDHAMWGPLSEGKDILFGWHANTQIPKFTGFHKYYQFTGDERFLTAATNFLEYCNSESYMGNRGKQYWGTFFSERGVR